MNGIRIKALTILFLFLFTEKSLADVIPLPGDLPTIEALISLHKLIKHDEDKAMERVTTSFGEQSLVTKGAGKFNDVRTTLNTKLNNAYFESKLKVSATTRNWRTVNELVRIGEEG